MRRLGIIGLIAAVLLLAPARARAAEPTWQRLAGETRYDTMAHILTECAAAGLFQDAAPDGAGQPGAPVAPSAPTAVVATAEAFPDALCASALAGAHHGPVILTNPKALSSQAAGQLAALRVERAYLMGGESALAPAVEDAIEALGIATSRVAGANRTLTSLAALDALREQAAPDTVIVATGSGFADALSIGPWAYATATPVVLAEPDGTLSAEAVRAIRACPSIRRVLAVGGQKVVSDDVAAQLGNGYGFERIAGEDRYKTSARVASWEVEHGFGWGRPAIATGTDYPDALAGAPLCGALRSPLLLTKYGIEATAELLFQNRALVTRGYLLGGPAAIGFDDPTRVVGLPLAGADAAQRALVRSAETTPLAGYGWCAAWVQDVYVRAGHPLIYGNACDLYHGYCTCSDAARLEPGMIVAVPSHPFTELGQTYGHVGVYVGDGWIRDNGTELRHVPLGLWLDHYGATTTPRWGWLLDGAIF